MRSRFSVILKCPHCGQIGQAVWEEASNNDRTRGPERQLIQVSSGFHPELGRTQSGDPLIICDECDHIQDD